MLRLTGKTKVDLDSGRHILLTEPAYAIVTGSCSCCVDWATRKKGVDLLNKRVEIVGQFKTWNKLVVMVDGHPEINVMSFEDDKENGYMFLCVESMKIHTRECVMK